MWASVKAATIFMSINQTNIIDFVSTRHYGKIVLSISDHHSWEESWHLQLLQDKINAYLHFIESGQITDQYPSAAGQELIIEEVMQFEPNEEAILFLKYAKEFIAGMGIEFQWRILSVE